MSDSSTVFPEPREPSKPTSDSGSWLKVVQKQVEGLRFGAVTITVHEGRVVQIETSQKVRFH